MPDPCARTVVFVHGLWVTAASWRPFIEPWHAAGYDVHTPEWPVLAGQSVDRLRQAPPAALGSLSVEMVVGAMAAFIRGFNRPPLLVGHSFGGLFIQLLLDQGLGRAGIALNPAPIAGVIPGFWTTGAVVPVILRPGGLKRAFPMTPRLWAQRFANGAPAALQAETWERYAVPTSGRIIRQAAFWSGTEIEHARRQPLLITSGDRDRLVTPNVSRAAFRIQARASAPTDFLNFEGRSHFLIAEPGWEEVAQACIDWDAKHRETFPPSALQHRRRAPNPMSISGASGTFR